MTFSLILDEKGLRHDTGAHPESVARLQALIDMFDADERFKDVARLDHDYATSIQVMRVHNLDYLTQLDNTIPDDGQTVYLDGDTMVSSGSLEAAYSGAGAACFAVDHLLTKASAKSSVFCATRPPGHHAERDHAMGFCLLNNVAIAAAHALESYGLKKVAIVDFDVHHGNGTDMFAREQNGVFYASTHQAPLFPGTGDPYIDGNHAGRVVNVPVPEGTDGGTLIGYWRDVILPKLSKFEPELLIFSAGFDAHKDDPLAGLNLEAADFATLTKDIIDAAPAPVLSVLEGGYDIAALQESVAAHCEVLKNHL